MDKLTGVTVNAYRNGSELNIAGDGYMGEITSSWDADKVSIVVETTNMNDHGFMVDRVKNIARKRDEAPEKGVTDRKVYSFRVPLKISLEGVPHTEYSSNNLRILRVNADGNLEIWEIALVSQGGQFFLTQQKTYTPQVFSNGDVTQVNNWPQILGLIASLSHMFDKLPPRDFISENKSNSIYVDDLSEGHARIEWFNVSQGFGAVVTPEGNAKVHWKNMKPKNGERLVNPGRGQLVQYGRIGDPVQTKGRPTNFKKEIFDVQVL